MLQFHLGVLSQGQLTPQLLINTYLKYGQVDEAINLLAALNWNTDGVTCHAALTTITNQLLRLPLNPDREGTTFMFFLSQGNSI